MTNHPLKIRAIHKSGSSLQSTIYDYINHLCNHNVIDFDRVFSEANHQEWFQSTKDSDIIVLRHPINRIISRYYSHGWTHCTDNFNDKSWKHRKKIRESSLSEYVISGKLLLRQRNMYEKILSISNVCFLKYEDIMDKPKRYMSLILNKIDRIDLLDKVYNNFKNEFVFHGKDRRDDIVNKGLISHVRNLDHKEYLNKFNECEIFFINRIMGDLLERYDNLSSI